MVEFEVSTPVKVVLNVRGFVAAALMTLLLGNSTHNELLCCCYTAQVCAGLPTPDAALDECSSWQGAAPARPRRAGHTHVSYCARPLACMLHPHSPTGHLIALGKPESTAHCNASRCSLLAEVRWPTSNSKHVSFLLRLKLFPRRLTFPMGIGKDPSTGMPRVALGWRQGLQVTSYNCITDRIFTSLGKADTGRLKHDTSRVTLFDGGTGRQTTSLTTILASSFALAGCTRQHHRPV